MQSLRKPPFFSGWPSRHPRLLIILGFAYTYLMSGMILVPQASATSLSMPGGNVSDPVVRQVDIARPAVVRIITRIDGRLTVRFTSSSSAVTFPLDGSSYPIELSGSGAFISAHGDILTADHVVNPPHDQALDEALFQIAAQDIADYVNSHFRVTQPLSASDVVASLETGTFQSSPDYAPATSRVYLSTAFTGPVSAAKFAEIPASDYATVDRIETQSSFDAMDVAVIHVSGMDDMPGIQLGDSGQVAEQDNLTIIGYPGLGDVSNAPTNLLTSSINRVYVSAVKTTDSGAPVIQVGGNVEHGDSGAPALDNGGHIVGIVSFGLFDPNESGETSFLQASNSARSLIQTQSINTTPGPFQQAWTQAFNDYASTAAGHWHRAARELRSLANTHRDFLGITAYLTYAQNQANSEQLSPTSAPVDSNAILVTVLALLALIVIVALLFIVMRQRRHPAQAVAVDASRFGLTPMGHYALQQNGASGVFPVAESYGSPYPTALTGHASMTRVEQLPIDVPATPQPVGNISPSEPSAQSFPSPVDTPVPAEENWSQTRDEVRNFRAWTSPLSPPAAVFPPTGEDRSPVVGLVPGSEIWPQGPESTSAPAEGLAVSGAGGADQLFEIQEQISPCGHLNPVNVRFCRVCGQPVTLVGLPESNDV